MKRAALWLLLTLLAGTAAWWGWRLFGPQPAPLDLTKHDGQTIDFSSGQPVVKDSPGDKAALEKAAAEMAEAAKGVTFEAPKKKPEQSPAPPKP
jgi:hypothetical protein